MKESRLTHDEIIFGDEAHRQLFLKGLEFIQPLTRGVTLVNEAMLQRALEIDFTSAQWLLQQLQKTDIDC